MVVIKNKNQRVGIFIDTQNLYHSARNIHKSRVNFSNLVKKVLADRMLVRSIAYVIATETGEEKAFFEALQKAGIETRLKDLQVFFGGGKKADWDVGIVVDMISLAPKLDVICLISGDGDFVPAIQYVKNIGCQVEVAAFEESSSAQLRNIADDFLNISKDKRSFLIRNTTRKTTKKIHSVWILMPFP